MITELKPTNLIAVEVAPDASKYELERANISVDLLYSTNLNIWQQGSVILKQGNYKILGEVTKDKIGFDVEKLGEVPLSSKEANELLNSNDKINFWKLLAANGLYFENPEGESYPYRFAESDGTLQTLDWHRNKWKEFEDKLIKGKLLILEKL